MFGLVNYNNLMFIGVLVRYQKACHWILWFRLFILKFHAPLTQHRYERLGISSFASKGDVLCVHWNFYWARFASNKPTNMFSLARSLSVDYCCLWIGLVSVLIVGHKLNTLARSVVWIQVVLPRLTRLGTEDVIVGEYLYFSGEMDE